MARSRLDRLSDSPYLARPVLPVQTSGGWTDERPRDETRQREQPDPVKRSQAHLAPLQHQRDKAERNENVPSKIRSHRLRLWNESPLCHWCGIETIWFETTTGRLPPNAATVDHVYSRLNPARHKSNNPIVLACSKCNQERGAADDEAFRHLRKEPEFKARLHLRGRSAQQVELRKWLGGWYW